MTARKAYSKADVVKALDFCTDASLSADHSAAIRDASVRFGVPERALRRRLQPREAAATSASALPSSMRRRGPKPLLSPELETQLARWIQTQQSGGHRVSRDDVIRQAQELLEPPNGQQEADTSVGMGWCNRFMARHPELSLRSGSNGVIQKASVASVVVDPPPDQPPSGTAQAIKRKLPDTQVEIPPSEAPDVTPSSNKDLKDTPSPTSRRYSRKHMKAAVEMVLAGRAIQQVAQQFPLLRKRTIRRRVLRVQRGEVDRRRGPKPLLEGEPERSLVAWVLERQQKGEDVPKAAILTRANEHYRMLTGSSDSEDRLKDGWLRRFKQRHPILSGRTPSVSQDQVLDGQEASSSGDLERGTEPRTPNPVESFTTLDSGKQSTTRLETMQRQQLAMLQQLSSNKTLPCFINRK
ncbi:hypothetical protein BBJ28_00023730 [Nothophytophthora sp. Chile5]|nr:hypothetical protein BBJ28_00023730 [Nothophytophthora sp. Chile5]